MMLFHKCLRLADLCDILKSQSAVPKIGSNAKLIRRSEKKCGKAATFANSYIRAIFDSLWHGS